MSKATPIKYTTEEGGEWIEAHARWRNYALIASSFEKYCVAWANFQQDKVIPERRIPILLEEVPGVVLAAAVALPNGRILDAVLGCFRDEIDKIRDLECPFIPDVKRVPRVVAKAVFYCDKFDS